MIVPYGSAPVVAQKESMYRLGTVGYYAGVLKKEVSLALSNAESIAKRSLHKNEDSHSPRFHLHTRSFGRSCDRTISEEIKNALVSAIAQAAVWGFVYACYSTAAEVGTLWTARNEINLANQNLKLLGEYEESDSKSKDASGELLRNCVHLHRNIARRNEYCAGMGLSLKITFLAFGVFSIYRIIYHPTYEYPKDFQRDYLLNVTAIGTAISGLVVFAHSAIMSTYNVNRYDAEAIITLKKKMGVW